MRKWQWRANCSAVSTRGFDRRIRIAETLRRELGDILCTESRDTRLQLLSLSHVRVSRDLSYADVYVVSLKAKDPAQRSELLRALKSAAGFLRSRLSSRVRWQKTPLLRFHYDELPEAGPRLEALIDSLTPARDPHTAGTL